jgi:hypothetical protein
MTSSEWLLYFHKQLDNNVGSQSVTLLGFNWAQELSESIESDDFSV